MGFVPKRANPNEANQIMNMIVEREVRMWPSADRRFIMPSDGRLKMNTITPNVNPRDPEMSRRIILKGSRITEEMCKARVSNLIERPRRIDKVMDTLIPEPKSRLKKVIPGSEVLGTRKVQHQHDYTPDGIPILLPERACEAIGFAKDHKFAHSMDKYRQPKCYGPLVKYAEVYQATLGKGPYSNKPMFLKQ